MGFFEENVDFAHVRRMEKLSHDALDFNDVPLLPLTMRAPVVCPGSQRGVQIGFTITLLLMKGAHR